MLLTTPHCQWLILYCLSGLVSMLFRTQITNISCAMFVVARHFHPLNKWLFTDIGWHFLFLRLVFSLYLPLWICPDINIALRCGWFVHRTYIWMRWDSMFAQCFKTNFFFSMSGFVCKIATLHRCTEIAKTLNFYSLDFFHENTQTSYDDINIFPSMLFFFKIIITSKSLNVYHKIVW